ncbi:MAG TPA: hypothetical protein PLQ85_02515 [Anaerolineae bacterium]|nr:hypothetical protein [Anaerolineae bacterium]HUM35724.1 hypothetical protein [Anaerolineae bacterium]
MEEKELEDQISRIKIVLRFILLNMEGQAILKGEHEFAGEVRDLFELVGVKMEEN